MRQMVLVFYLASVLFCSSAYSCPIDSPEYVSFVYGQYVKANFNEKGKITSHGAVKNPHSKKNCPYCKLSWSGVDWKGNARPGATYGDGQFVKKRKKPQ